MLRHEYLTLIRVASAARFSPEAYLLAASCFGSFAGLPASPGSLRALGLDPDTHGAERIVRRDAAYLTAWAERTEIDAWDAGSMLLASVAPARLPWHRASDAIVVARDRWPEGYQRLRALDVDGAGVVTVGDVHRFASRTTVAGRRLLIGLDAARDFARDRGIALP